MIDTDKYEGCITDMKGYDLAILTEELLAEVKQLREEVNTLNEIIDTERKKVYDIAQKLLEVIE